MGLRLKQMHQKQYFEDFGFLILPGVLADRIGEIEADFERIFRENGVVHDGTKRSGCGQMLESSEILCSILEHPEVDGMLTAVLGENYNYLGSAGELYVAGGMWHPDATFNPNVHAKMAMYLDHLTADTGALRYIPGSHKGGWEGNQDTYGKWGISPEEVPCIAPENFPGDLCIFNLKTVHNSLGGGNRRRMLNMGLIGHAHTEEQRKDLVRHFSKPPYSDLMLRTLSPEYVSRHLQQILDLSG
ncbi:MAG: phytanoyl-CoA dioxygenase family protein [candidate division Zixibacteria bacterium]|nr:phytanoyl-CoA dioxygenase family protein [candidate division Zixibacteria bacterium]